MNHQKTYINGQWREANGAVTTDLVDSYTEAVFARVRTSSLSDVDLAVASARAAWPAWSRQSTGARAAALQRVAAALVARSDALIEAISREVGMPRKLVRRIQVEAPIAAWRRYAELAVTLDEPVRIGHSIVERVPTGVVACITPWNYPLHQITAKVAPALAAGCAVVLKPSEIAPLSAFLLADAIAAADLPAGVFNLVHGHGEDIGDALVRHADVDMISFTGSTAAGRRIAATAGSQLKRLGLELGGKSASVVLPGADLAQAVKATLASCLLNSGQTCSASTRLLVPRDDHAVVIALLRAQMGSYVMGDPAATTTRLGPLVSAQQRARVTSMIDAALVAGAEVIAGGHRAQPVPPHGFFVPPTVLGNVTPAMPIAQQEVFGPVLVLMAYDTVADAVAIANDTRYGLAASVWGATPEAAHGVARALRAGQVDINGALFNPDAPFGGFGDSGVGRENGPYGLEAFVETISYQLPAGYAGRGSNIH